MRVLVVDDSSVSAQVVKGLLDSFGCSVVIASSGDDGVEACLGSDFDAVIMDLHMPGLDGCQAAREIRRREADGHRTLIIALTGEEQDHEHGRCLDAGMDECLVKPIGGPALRAALQRLVAGAPGTPGAARASSPPTAADAAIDVRVLEELGSYIGPEAVAERIEDYLDHLERRLRSLRDASSSGEATDDLRRMIHGLKGTSGFVGAKRLAALCREAEGSRDDPARPLPPELLEALEREGAEVARSLREWQQKSGSA